MAKLEKHFKVIFFVKRKNFEIINICNAYYIMDLYQEKYKEK